MKIKSIALDPKRVKAGPNDGLAEGQFVGYASVFGNVDSYGDIVQKGAFANTLTDWSSKGVPIPILWGHDMVDPYSNICGTLSAEEDDHGLKITGQLDLDNPKAQQVYRLLKGRRVGDMSFAYDVVDSTKDGDNQLLTDLKLYEVSVVPIGANQETEILAVKANASALEQGVKAGRVLAQKHIDSLRSAQEAIGAVIAAALDNDQGEKASGEAEVKSGADDEEPEGVKSSVPDEEPKRGPSVDDLAAQITIYALKGAERGSR